jgi:hypothetical protein
LSQPVSRQAGDNHLAESAWNGNVPYFPEVTEREMQADAEHQEDHPQLGKLAYRSNVANKPGRERTNCDSCHHVADEGWQTDAPGNRSSKERSDKSDSYIDEQR